MLNRAEYPRVSGCLPHVPMPFRDLADPKLEVLRGDAPSLAF